ncbi:predicted protein [Plenodomus lingam JN3]|uniref:Predicted protein n=1 Tax=Leptosphaeria maculans (strain JN3 / isolate v23.1.3 / race Av1-4-5-6-7-8) TaxID=985895 RepID=E5A1I8_LEPMJ|nr:predicted protein [Plenodomus lingam JN3]CBX97452.1 predicted protein [Plenodomus lingam JN3]
MREVKFGNSTGDLFHFVEFWSGEKFTLLSVLDSFAAMPSTRG